MATKKELMKSHKKGTEIKLISLDKTQELRGHITGYWQMGDGGWGVECQIVGQEKLVQLSAEDVIRVFKDEKGKEQGTPENPIVVNSGDVVDEDTGDVIRTAPKAEEPHPMEEPQVAGSKTTLTAELTEELAKLDSVAAKIRYLLNEGMGRSEVAKMLGVGYRYVYAIEHKPLKREMPLILVPHETGN